MPRFKVGDRLKIKEATKDSWYSAKIEIEDIHTKTKSYGVRVLLSYDKPSLNNTLLDLVIKLVDKDFEIDTYSQVANELESVIEEE